MNDLEEKWPFIEWRKPLPVAWPDASLFSCRLCIARLGLNRDSPHQWATPQETLQHIEARHP